MLILTAAARGYLAFAVTLIAAAALPAVGPCDSFVVLTGSMAPVIEPGDVVLVTALDGGEDVPMGRVVAFRAAAPPPRDGEVVLHRVVAQRPDGDFTTAGDANRDTDSAALRRDAVIGRARVLVPWAGLPVLWWHQGTFVVLAAWLLLTALAVVLVVTGDRTRGPTDPGGEPPPDGPGPEPSDRAAADQPDWVQALFDTALIRRGRTALAAVVCVLITGAALQTGAAAADFTSGTRTAGNSWAVSKSLVSPYTAQVLTDHPWGYYPLEEAAGPTMIDASGNGRNGAFTAPITYHQAGALTTSTSYAITLAGARARAVATKSSATSRSSRSRPTKSTPRSPRLPSGTLTEIIAQEGQTVGVNTVVARIAAKAKPPAQARQREPPPHAPPPAPAGPPRRDPLQRPHRIPHQRQAASSASRTAAAPAPQQRPPRNPPSNRRAAAGTPTERRERHLARRAPPHEVLPARPQDRAGEQRRHLADSRAPASRAA